MTDGPRAAPLKSRVPGGRIRVWPPASIRWRSLSFRLPPPSATPRVQIEVSGRQRGRETRSGRGSEAQERVREAGADRRAGSDAPSEGRLGFGDFLEGGEKGQGS